MLCAFNWSMVGFKTCLSNVENIQILQIASLVAHTVVGVCVRAVWYIWMGMVYKSDRYVIIDICECGSQVRGELYLWCGTYVRFWCFLCQRWVITVVYFLCLRWEISVWVLLMSGIGLLDVLPKLQVGVICWFPTFVRCLWSM